LLRAKLNKDFIICQSKSNITAGRVVISVSLVHVQRKKKMRKNRKIFGLIFLFAAISGEFEDLAGQGRVNSSILFLMQCPKPSVAMNVTVLGIRHATTHSAAIVAS
jgi:hypothetical protein